MFSFQVLNYRIYRFTLGVDFIIEHSGIELDFDSLYLAYSRNICDSVQVWN